MNSSSTFFSTCLLLVVMIHAFLLQPATAKKPTPPPTTTTPPSTSPTNAPQTTINLQDYTLPAPVCTINGDDNVQCDCTGIVPAAGNLDYSITGFADCTGTAARSAEISLPVATATAASGAHSVTIDLNTNFDLAHGASQVFEFCLLTNLKDGNNKEMIYQGQRIKATFQGNGGFTVSDIASGAFNGLNNVVVDKTFAITARRCDINRNTITSPALAIGVSLFICVDSTDANTVVKSVDTFGATKTSGATPTDLLTGNTEVRVEGTGAVTIGTRPFVEFFVTSAPLQISGTVTLAVKDTNGRVRRHLARILLSGLSEEFGLQVELEAVEESSANSAAFGTAAIALLGATIVAIM